MVIMVIIVDDDEDIGFLIVADASVIVFVIVLKIRFSIVLITVKTVIKGVLHAEAIISKLMGTVDHDLEVVEFRINHLIMSFMRVSFVSSY